MTWDWTPGLLARLGAALRDRGLVDGDVTARRIGDGHSNLTYLVNGGDRSVVVRRPPPPPLPPGGHDMLREARMIGALGETAVPVPRLLATFETGDLLDVPCYVMSHVDGPVVTTETPAPLDSPEARRRVGESLVDVLAALHEVDWRAVGGRPEGFNLRHLGAVARLVPDDAPAGFTALHDWLVAHAPPESGASIVHNDYRLGNVLLAAPGRVAAVLDWELATVGDPLFDLGYFLASVPEDRAVTATEELGTAMLEDGWPTRTELADRYAEATGRDVTALGWYVAMAQWKLAALYEYQRRRGTDPYYDDPSLVAAFVSAGERAAS